MNGDLPISLLARRAGVIAAVLALTAAPAHANIYSFATPGGSAVNDGPEAAIEETVGAVVSMRSVPVGL